LFIEDDPNATFRLLKKEFIKRGYTYIEELHGEQLYLTLVSPMDKSWSFYGSKITYPFTSAEVKKLSIHKEIASKYVEKQGISVPFTYFLATNVQLAGHEAEDMIQKYGTLIVKPANDSLSRGLTLNITNFASLNDAIKYSRQFKDGVLIQEQVEGEEIRFVAIKGRVEAALLRQTARIVGDGSSTIAMLIESENIARKSLSFPMISYPQLTDELIDPKLFTDITILPKNEIKELNRATMIKNGASVYNVIEKVHPTYIDAVEKLVRNLHTDFLVVDMFVKDYRAEKTDENYWFIEFNTSPVLKLFYGCRDGNMFDIVPLLADAIDEKLHSKG
jgi:D-alanine-D-alanine ligase-like ATP-grasp enzyme